MQTLEQRVGQTFLFGFDGLSAPEHILTWLSEGRLGGVILFSRNVASPSQLAELTHSLHSASPTPIFIAIDQEGGTVARLREGFTEAPSALALAKTGSPAHVETSYRLLGEEMRQLGINWDYAPVVDISYNRDNPTVGTRSFGATAHDVAEFARYAVRGLQGAGVLACAKHFPGLGNTAVDTHLALATLDTPLEHLLAHDLEPYRAVIAEGVGSVMTTHTRFTQLDDTYPATLSPVIVARLLREGLGYDGYITTDCMEMKAISANYGAGESAVLAVLAGIDSVLVSHTRPAQEAAYDALLHAVRAGRVSEAHLDASLARRERLLARFAITHTPHAEGIRPAERVATMRAIAREAVRVARQAQPLTLDEGVLLVEFASVADSEVMEKGGQSSLKRLLDERGLTPRYAALLPTSDEPTRRIMQALNLGDGDAPAPLTLEDVIALAQEARVVVIATRNAHLVPSQAERARAIANASARVVHVCLRNPYDDDILPSAEAVLYAFGDSEPSLAAVLDALSGAYTPQQA
jgi:beta-N-acetylhexosaminidase